MPIIVKDFVVESEKLEDPLVFKNEYQFTVYCNATNKIKRHKSAFRPSSRFSRLDLDFKMSSET